MTDAQQQQEMICIGHGHGLLVRLSLLATMLFAIGVFLAMMRMNINQETRMSDIYILYINGHFFTLFQVAFFLTYLLIPFSVYPKWYYQIIVGKKCVLAVNASGELYYNNNLVITFDKVHKVDIIWKKKLIDKKRFLEIVPYNGETVRLPYIFREKPGELMRKFDEAKSRF